MHSFSVQNHCAFVVILLSFLVQSVHAGHSFWLRDSTSGAPVIASVNVYDIDETAYTQDAWQKIRAGHWTTESLDLFPVESIQVAQGRVQLEYAGSTRLIEIRATDYQTLRTYLEPGTSVVLSTLWLDPDFAVHQANEMRCQTSAVCGWVRDASDLHPLAAAEIWLGSRTTLTDQDGFFYIQHVDADSDRLIVVKESYRQSVWFGLAGARNTRMVIDLKTGQGSDTHDLRHPLELAAQGQVDHDWLIARQYQTSTPIMTDTLRERPGGASFMAPPSSIRVGFDASGGYCCGGNCSTTQVYTLETYVQRGLDNEWISSWQSDSLKSGTVPFRSYGAWHVLNPPYNGYDICAGPCCQAFEFTGFGSTMAAGAATNGIMLELNGNLARSEYSAENNSWNDPDDGLSCTNADLSCGDGFVGSPATGWPCLDDDSVGRGCFGHGRGMSQWGTQYRALAGSNWADIIDHYYNASGNPSGNRSQYATSPIRLDGVTPGALEVMPGQSLQLQFDLFNAADISHPFGPVMLGASLISDTIDYSDPANDAVIQIKTSGLSTETREFNVSSDAEPGMYDLAVALWLDVDGDSIVTSADWVLAFQHESDLITLSVLSDELFMDSFE